MIINCDSPSIESEEDREEVDELIVRIRVESIDTWSMDSMISVKQQQRSRNEQNSSSSSIISIDHHRSNPNEKPDPYQHQHPPQHQHQHPPQHQHPHQHQHHRFWNHPILISNSNGQLINLRSIDRLEPGRGGGGEPLLLTHHSHHHHPNPSKSIPYPPSLTHPSPTSPQLDSNRSISSSSSSLPSQVHHPIKASSTVSISIPQFPNPIDHQPIIIPTSSPLHHQLPSIHHQSQDRLRFKPHPTSSQTYPIHPSSPSSPTLSLPSNHHPHHSSHHPIFHHFESIWQGSNHPSSSLLTSSSFLNHSLQAGLSSSDRSPKDLLPSTSTSYLPPSPSSVHHPTPLTIHPLSFCSSTLLNPFDYPDPILSIHHPPSQDHLNLPSSHPITQHDSHHPIQYSRAHPIVFTLTKFGKCSKVSLIDGHIIRSIDLNRTDALVQFDDWVFLSSEPPTHNDRLRDDPQPQEGTLICCISSELHPILLDSCDLKLIPTNYVINPSMEKPIDILQSKILKQSRIAKDHWSIDLVSLTYSQELWIRGLKVSWNDRGSHWTIEASQGSILIKSLVGQLELDGRVQFVVDQTRLALWSADRFWILEKTWTDQQISRRPNPYLSETTQLTLDDDLIVSLSFLGSFGVVVVSKKQVKLFRFTSFEPSIQGWSEWRVKSIDEVRFSQQDSSRFEAAINTGTLPSSMENHQDIIKSINLLTVDVDLTTGQRKLSELCFTTGVSSDSTLETIPSSTDADQSLRLSIPPSQPLSVHPRLTDLYRSVPILGPDKPPTVWSTCAAWLEDEYHPRILVGDSIGQVSVYTLDIPSGSTSTSQPWRLERLSEQERIGGPVSALYADQRWILAGGVLGDLGVWVRRIHQPVGSVDQSDQLGNHKNEMELVTRTMVGPVPIESFGRLSDLEQPDGEGKKRRLSRFVCVMVDGSVVVWNLNDEGSFEIEGQLIPSAKTIGVSELWSNGPEIMVFYRERRLTAQRCLPAQDLVASISRDEAKMMIKLENSQSGYRWAPIRTSSSQAYSPTQPGGPKLGTSRVVNLSGSPIFNSLSVSLRDFVGSIGLQDGPALAGRLSMVRLMVSQLLPWGFDSALDESAVQGLGIRQPSPEERSKGLRLISDDRHERSGLVLCSIRAQEQLGSEHERTYRVLYLVVLLRVFLNEARYERHASETIVGIARLAGGTHHDGSSSNDSPTTIWLDLKILVKYWLDRSADVREAARLLFGVRLGSMGNDELEGLVSTWHKFLPIQDASGVKIDNDRTLRRRTDFTMQIDVENPITSQSSRQGVTGEKQLEALLLIGLIVSERYKLLSTKVLKDLSIAVFQATSPPNRQPAHQFSRSRLEMLKAGLEICSKTFEIIQNYIDAIELVRNLFGWATGKDGECPGELKAMAKYACLHVASVNTPLFMTTLSYDLMMSDNPNDRISTMKLVVFMVRRRPLVLHASLPRLLEAVVKSLDPTQKQMRAQTQTGATVILHELVKTYPSITFHGPSQKLAIGTPEGAIIIYDLKTSTKINILESFRKPVSACSFSQDGLRLVSVSLEENRIEIWKFNSTPFGLSNLFKFTNLASTTTTTTTSNPTPIVIPSTDSNHPDDPHGANVRNLDQPPGSTGSNSNRASGHQTKGMSQKPFKSLSFNVGEEAMMSIAGTLEWVRFDWINHRSCRLRIRQSSITFSC